MKKGQKMIAMLLSMALVFGLCGSEVTVQTAMAQDVQEDVGVENKEQEVQETMGEERQKLEEASEDVLDEKVMEDSSQAVDKTEETVSEEANGEVSEKTAQRVKQKEIEPQMEDMGNNGNGESNGNSADGGKSRYTEYTLYITSLINGRYNTSSGNFADGVTVEMEIEAESEKKDAMITYEWYKAGSKTASVETAKKLNVNKEAYTIKKSGVKTEYYICVVSDGNETERVVFEIKGTLLHVSTYVNDKPKDNTEKYEYGKNVKLEVKPESVDKKYQITYQWQTKGGNDIAGATKSVYNTTISDSWYSNYYCVVTMKEGNEIIQSEKYAFLLETKETLTVSGAIHVDGKKYVGTSKSVYEGTNVKLEISAESSHGKIQYNWDNNVSSGVDYSFKKDNSEYQRFSCEVTDGVNEESIDFYIYKASRIKGVRQIDGKNKNTVYCSSPGEKHELKVNLTSAPAGSRYEYTWEKHSGIDHSDYDPERYEGINGASGQIYSIEGKDIAGDTTYRCTVKDGTDIRRFKFYVYADSLNCVCMANQKERYRIQVSPGEKVIFEVKAESLYNNAGITYKWYQGYYEENDNVDNQQEIGQESSYTFVKNSEKDDEGYCTEYYTCVISDGFQTDYEQFVAEANDVLIEGTALIDGRRCPSLYGIYDAEIPAVHNKSYRLEVKMTSRPKSGEYKYRWGTANGSEGMTQRFSETSPVCMVNGGLSYENDKADYYVCIVKDGNEQRTFRFCLEPYSITADQKIDGKTVSEVYLPAGKTVELSIDASSTYTSSNKIKYSWERQEGTDIAGKANRNKYTVTKSEDMEQEYRCIVEDGYSTQIYTFALYSDSLGVPVCTIDGKAVRELQCAEGTKHTIVVDVSCSDEDVTYEWDRIDEDGESRYLENKNKNSLTFTRKGKMEIYSCEIYVAGVRRNIYFNFSTDGYSCRHKFSEQITKATLTQDGNIIERCMVCGKVDSSQSIPYPKTIRLSSETFTYNGKVQTPSVTVIGSDNRTIDAANYTIAYSAESKAVGNYTVTITFKGNYTGSITKTYKINPAQTSGNGTSTNTGNKKNVKVSKIKLSGISKKIAAGKKIKLTANITPSNAVNKSVTWKSSNKKIATVNSKGVVTMNKKSGGKSVTITATAKDGSKVKAAYKITSMKGVVKKLAISGKKTVKAGKTLKLKAKVTATKKANKTLKWTSSNKKYATVSSSGKVKALKAGKGKKVKITAMATDGSGKKKAITIKIK